MEIKKCAAFWKHTNVRGNNQIFPCCRFKSPVGVFDGNLDSILFSEAYEKLRNSNIDDLPQCAKCSYEEKNNKKSLRQKFNEQYDTDKIELEFLEIGFDNICNLTCDGCWSDWSSSWSKKINPDADKKSHYTSIEEIKHVPKSVRKILFLGGEPLMTNRHEKFLELIENPSLVDVIYNTNGTFILRDDFVVFLQKFKSAKFILSIDAYGNLNDKVRSGSSWKDIIYFIEQIKRFKFDLEVNTVLHINNWHGIKKLESFVRSLNVEWTINILTYPKHLDISNIENKNQILDIINQTDIPNKSYVLNHLTGDLHK